MKDVTESAYLSWIRWARTRLVREIEGERPLVPKSYEPEALEAFTSGFIEGVHWALNRARVVFGESVDRVLADLTDEPPP